jgi:hypothetical protein
MDFIERLFGFAPDGGDGSFELLLFAIPLVVVALLYWRTIQRRLFPGRQTD